MRVIYDPPYSWPEAKRLLTAKCRIINGESERERRATHTLTRRLGLAQRQRVWTNALGWAVGLAPT